MNILRTLIVMSLAALFVVAAPQTGFGQGGSSMSDATRACARTLAQTLRSIPSGTPERRFEPKTNVRDKATDTAQASARSLAYKAAVDDYTACIAGTLEDDDPDGPEGDTGPLGDPGDPGDPEGD